MKRKNKRDNLEQFFHRVLKGYEESPRNAVWDRISKNIPSKTIAKPFIVYKTWMIIAAFLSGIIISTIFFYWKSSTQIISNLEGNLILQKELIETKSQENIALTQIIDKLKKENDQLSLSVKTLKENFLATSETWQAIKNNPKKLEPNNSSNKNSLIKLEIAHMTGVAAPSSPVEKGWLPLFPANPIRETLDLFSLKYPKTSFSALNHKSILFDNQLISHTFFIGNKGDTKTKKLPNNEYNKTENDTFLVRKRNLKIDFNSTAFQLDSEERSKLKSFEPEKMIFSVGDDGLTSFISATINPFSGLKYNLEGYKPQTPDIKESVGIISSWNWSVYGGIEAKSKWSVQVGFDYNRLTIVKESINNVRFNQEKAEEINNGFLYSINQKSDGALGQIIVNSNIFNQQKNDGQDIEHGDLFKLFISTEQPVQIVRLPILGGYRFDVAPRFYITPKIGISAVWKTKDQTQLRSSSTFSDRLSIQSAAIFLTNKTTTESLEANLRAEFGFRWRPRWYLFAEPRFKYSGKPLFEYRNLELKDSPLHLMLGIRFNVD